MRIYDWDEMIFKPCFANDMAAELNAQGPVTYLVRGPDAKPKASSIEPDVAKPGKWRFMWSAQNLR